MSDTKDDALNWVVENMPTESAASYAAFVGANPRMRGANWDDILETLMGTDAHLSVTEPIQERMQPERPRLVRAVALTLLYADMNFVATTDEIRAVMVAACIANHERAGV